jgi:hypothetical protein
MYSITIKSDEISAEELKESLETEFAGSRDITLKVENDPQTRSGIDPTVIVSIIGGFTTVLTTLITCLFNKAKTQGSRQIILLNRHGKRIEISTEVSPENLKSVVVKAEKDQVERIILK